MSVETEVAAPTARRSLPPGVMRNLGLAVAFVLICLIGVITAGERFYNPGNILTILKLAAAIGVVAIGQTFVITSGGIDLSVGSVLGLCTVAATLYQTQTYGWIAIVATALVVGVLCGVINGVLVAYGRIVPFIATLAVMVTAKGTAEILSNYKTLRIPSPDLAPYPYAQAEAQKFLDYFTGDLLGLPVIVWMFFVVAVIAWLVYNRTTFGRRVTAIGGNMEASRLAGLRIKPNLIYIYALCGLCVGIGALIILARTTAGTATHGELYEMDAIAAVVVGGTLLMGGRGTIVGTVIGTLLFVTLTDIFILNNLAVSTQKVAKGLIIIGAVLLQQYLAQRERTT